MKKILFVIAMEKEAIDIAKKLNLHPIENNERTNSKNKIFQKNNISLLISGIGKQQTAINLTKYLENNEKPDLMINMGYVGATKRQIGEWVNINKSYNYEWNIPGEQKYTVEGFEQDKIKLLSQLELDEDFNKITKTLKNEDKEIKEIPCYSAECFVTSTEIKDDVVFDMELHSIYMICCIYGINVISLKKVSDNLSLDEYYKNIDMKEVLELTSGLELLQFTAY